MFQATTTKRPASAESGMKLAKGAATSTNVAFDVDGMTVAKANTKVEDTVIKTIVIGDAYLEKGKKDTRRTFLCLIGEKGKVLLTFFTDK
jgi:alpha-D-ribose 1-methylphosphonate 5-triphosphate synthase subunit PhnG